jgi:CubicO group peptidase (beta-lactamase class C family)
MTGLGAYSVSHGKKPRFAPDFRCARPLPFTLTEGFLPEVNGVFKRSVVYAVLLLLPAFALAAERPAETGNPAIRAAVEKFIDAQDISGAVTVVAVKDKLLAVDTIGLADIAKKKLMEPDSLFWIASMTKPLTAVSILMLQDEGKLKVSDPVEKFLPEFAALKTPTGRLAHITIEQILTHTSGLGEGDSTAIQGAHTLGDLIPIYLASPMLYEPGERWRYTQSGINVAARIVEVTSGLSFDEFVGKHLLKPLGMRHTTFYPNKKQRSHLATPYIKDKQTGTLAAAPYAGYGNKGQPPFGNAGLFSTGPDYARFCQMLLFGRDLRAHS